MNKHTPKIFIGFLFIIMIVGLLAWTMQPPAPVQAGGELPARNTPISSPANKDAGNTKNKNSQPVGAYIELHLSNPADGAWTVVQWQDNAGDWQDVEGWQGSPNSDRQRWWVATRDFGRGPFRWIVTQGPDGTLLGTSQPFQLPTKANQVVPIHIPD